jgi:hypothetical protein
MAKKQNEVTFDSMVRYFLRVYNIPTRRDLNKINTRLDRIEKLVNGNKNWRPNILGRPAKSIDYKPAWQHVLDAMPEKGGVGFTEIKERTDFDERKIRNIIFRLFKHGKIKRIARGLYVSSQKAGD